jgi:glycosyltransferase involved in cell wall biosynthesis
VTEPPANAGLDWVKDFERRHGRRLRVLHLGNIANNAYNNAKIQRRRGIEADVSCHDYFHIMGCPEWEDADFEGSVVDDFFPDWWNVDLRGFERPEWFAQGNWQTCARYLGARVRGERGPASLLARQLTVERWLWCRSTPAARALGYRGGAAHWLRFAASVVRGLRRKAPDVVRAGRKLARGEGTRAAAETVLPTRLGTGVEAMDTTEIGRTFSARFPDRSALRSSDLRGYRRQAAALRSALEHYDVVQGYAIDGIVPLLAGATAWASYEHGTLREIPFEDSPRGRICALVYAESPAVFVTNSDVLPSLERLGLDPKRVVYLPHAVDTDRLFAFADGTRVALPDVPTIYSPTRQDWVDRDLSWSKGNDLLLHAAARTAERHDFRLALGEWGRDLDASRALARELGLAERIEWVPQLRKRELWTRYLGSHAVADQFTLPAIGGVAFEAMALGRRVITALDTAQTERFFGAAPPLLAAQDVDTVAAAFEAVVTDADDRAGVGAASRAWVAERHSSDRIVDLQATAYRTLLGRA